MTRKEKVAKKNAEKQAKVVTPIDNQRIENKIDDKGIATAQLQKATGAPSLENRSIEAEDELTAIKGPRAAELGMSVDENNTVKYPDYQRNAGYAIRDIKQKMPTGATQQKATGAPNVVRPAEPKPLTFSDYLAKQRENLKQDKTDAEKMQKYYALTDVFNALGKMGGAAVGGAIGGNMLDSAPAVGEYQQSRGYLDAFERAKQANDRLRALDEQEFGLAYNKQQRDEERAYQAAEKKAEREYRAQLDALDKQWQKDMIDYRAKIDAAVAANNMELKAQYEAEQAAKEQEYWKERQAITHKAEMDIKNLSKEIVAMQMGGAYNADGTGRTGNPFFFDDDTVAYIDSEDMQALRDRFIGSQLGNAYIDEDNFNRFLAQNPAIVATYLNKVGKDSSFYTPPVEVAPAAKSSWKPNPNKFYGYGNGYLPSNKQTKKEEAQEEYSIENDPMRDLLSK